VADGAVDYLAQGQTKTETFTVSLFDGTSTVTKDVTVNGKAQLAGNKAEIAGSTSIVMTDYGVSPPQVPFVTVDSTLLIEFDIFLVRSA
jgi:hypothetical protein